MALYQEYAQALGEMSMSFQELENTLLELLASLTNGADPTVGFIVGSTLPFRKLCQVIGALSMHRVQDADLNELLSGILSRCQKLEYERNTYIHSFYPTFCFGDGLEVLGRFKHKLSKRGYAPHLDDHDPEKIQALAFKFGSCTHEVNEFLKELRELRIAPSTVLPA
jgi:hypothetical protein